MNFGQLVTDPNAWKRSGVVTGVHTHVAPVIVSELESISDASSKLEVKADQVHITKDLQVDGQLIMSGWPPPGGDMKLPEDPTFHTVTTTGEVNVKGQLRATGGTYMGGVLRMAGTVTMDTGIVNNDLTVSGDSHLQKITMTRLDGPFASLGSLTVLHDSNLQHTTVTELGADHVTMGGGHSTGSLIVDGETTVDVLTANGKSNLKETTVTEFGANYVTMGGGHSTGDFNVDGKLTMKSGSVTGDFTIDGKLDALIDSKEDINTSKNVYASTFDGTTVDVYNSKSTIVKTTTISHITDGKAVVAGKFHFQEDVTADNDVHVDKGTVYADTVVATSEISGALVNADIKVTTKDVAATGQVSGETITAQGLISGKNLTVTDKLTTKDLHVNGSLDFNGTFKPRSIHIEVDSTFGKQTTHINESKITIFDTNPAIWNTGQGEITLDGGHGSIKCNGQMVVHNQYDTTGNPSGVQADFISTMPYLDAISGHRSDFGKNLASESIYAVGGIQTDEGFYIDTSLYPKRFTSDSEFCKHTIQMLTPEMHTNSIRAYDTAHNSNVFRMTMNSENMTFKTSQGQSLMHLTDNLHVDIHTKLGGGYYVEWGEEEQTRIAVGPDQQNGQLFLGRWDKNIPSTANGDNLDNFADLNIQGDIRFSDRPTNWASGQIYGGLTNERGLEIHRITAYGSLLAYRPWDFSNAEVSGLPGGSGGGGYPSIEEHPEYVTITKPLKLAYLNVNVVGSMNIGVIEFEAGLDMTKAHIIGDLKSLDKEMLVGADTSHHRYGEYVIQEVIDGDVVRTVGTAGGQTISWDKADTSQFNTIKPKQMEPYDDSIKFVGQMDFTNATLIGLGNQLYPSISENETKVVVDKPLETAHILTNDISPTDPDNGELCFTGHVDFENAHVTGLYPSLSEGTGGLVIAADKSLQFTKGASSPASLDPTMITEMGVRCEYVGQNMNRWEFTTTADGFPMMLAKQKLSGESTFAISSVLVVSTAPIQAPKTGSSGNFTNCHLTEGSQAEVWQAGRCVTSTGEFCSRTDEGVLIGSPKDAPSGSHAVCKVTYSSKGDRPLGIIASVETVNDSHVLHEHGGLTLKASIQEADGHSMVRVAGSGDVLAWVVEPTFDEVDMPSLSGLWEKCKDGEYGSHIVMSRHVGIEAEGYLSVDGQILDTNECSVEVSATEVKVTPPTPQLTPGLFSGVYTKSINGVVQPIQVVMICNPDYSFCFTEHYPGIEDRIAVVETTLAELLGPDTLS